MKYKSKTSYRLLFRKAEFTYHKPERIYHEHNEQEVAEWKKRVKPKLKKLWKEKDTVILAEDEMILTTRTTIQKIWLPKGEYPKIEAANGTVQRRNVYGFLNIRTGAEPCLQNKQAEYACNRGNSGTRPYDVSGTKDHCLLGQCWLAQRISCERIYQAGRKHTGHSLIPDMRRRRILRNMSLKQGRANVTHNRFIEDIDAATDEFVQWLNNAAFPYSLLGFGNIS